MVTHIKVCDCDKTVRYFRLKGRGVLRAEGQVMGECKRTAEGGQHEKQLWVECKIETGV